MDWRPELSVADAEAREGIDPTVDFEVSLSRAASGGVAVEFETADGTAEAGKDYRATSGTLVFGPGERRKVVKVPIIDDGHDEGRETFTFRLFKRARRPDRGRRGDGDDPSTPTRCRRRRSHGSGARWRS